MNHRIYLRDGAPPLLACWRLCLSSRRAHLRRDNRRSDRCSNISAPGISGGAAGRRQRGGQARHLGCWLCYSSRKKARRGSRGRNSRCMRASSYNAWGCQHQTTSINDCISLAFLQITHLQYSACVAMNNAVTYISCLHGLMLIWTSIPFNIKHAAVADILFSLWPFCDNSLLTCLLCLPSINQAAGGELASWLTPLVPL